MQKSSGAEVCYPGVCLQHHEYVVKPVPPTSSSVEVVKCEQRLMFQMGCPGRLRD